MIEKTTTIRVLYGHTDQMQVVYYGRYFEYFEAGRNELLRSLHLPYYRMEAEGLMLPVIESHANYKGSFAYDENVHVRTLVKNMPTVRITIDYELFGDDQAVRITGHTVHAFIDRTTRRPVRIPVEIQNAFKPYFEK